LSERPPFQGLAPHQLMHGNIADENAIRFMGGTTILGKF
jgi:hypothetical protein